MYSHLSKSPAEQLGEVITRIYNLHLTTPSGGNISMLDDDGILWVTPSQVDKGRLEPEDMIKIFPDGTIEGRHKPTMEYRFHQEIYHARPDIRAITHAHSPGLVALSMVNHTLTFDHIPSLKIDQNSIGYSKYAIPGSVQLGENISAAFTGGCHSVFMENHGIITTGRNLREAFHRLENMETLASIYIESLRIGKIKSLTFEDLNLFRGHNHITSSIGKRHIISEQEQKNRENLLEIVKRTYERKLITAVSGGFSVRVDETSFVITPEGLDINDLGSNDLVFIKEGQAEQGKIPSQFSFLHHEIYRRHKLVNFICSAHPISVMAFAITGTPLDSRTIPESFLILNEIPLVPFRKRIEHPEEIADLISPRIPGVLIMNDCITVTGTSPFQVFDRLEVAEFTARSIINSKPIGSIKPISDQDINDLVKAFT